MPVGTNSRNGNHCPRDAKTNGDEDSSNSDDGSSMCKLLVNYSKLVVVTMGTLPPACRR